MAIINHFIDDLINENKIFSDTLFIENATVIPENLHHSVKNIQYVGWLNIVSRRGHKIDSKLLCEEVVYPIDILH